MSIRLVKTPFAPTLNRDSATSMLHSVDTNLPTSSDRNGQLKPRGPRRAFAGFKGGVIPSPVPACVSSTSHEPSPPPKRPFTRSRGSPYADAYPGKAAGSSRLTRASLRRAQTVFEAVQEEEEEPENSDRCGAHTKHRQYITGISGSLPDVSTASLYKPLPSGWSLTESNDSVDYSKQVAGLLLSRVSDGRVPRSTARDRKEYVKSGLSRSAVSS